ncbi:hypothetical protein D3C76_1749230 [compost metagenome]
MFDRHIVRQGQAGRVEDARLGTEVFQQARGFFHQQAAEGAFAGRSVEQQDTGLVVAAARRGRRRVEKRKVEVGQLF